MNGDRLGPVAVALEGSSRPASVAVTRGVELRNVFLDDGQAHASDLVPRLEALLAELGVRAADIGVVVVGLGPGSYTGLRVAAATALGLALGNGAELVGVPSFEALALRKLAPGDVGDVLVDARGGQLYHARYRRGSGDTEFEVLAAPRALTPEESRAALGDSVWLADAAALAALGSPVPAGVRLDGDVGVDARDVLRLGLERHRRGEVTAPDALAPLYLRGFTPLVRGR